MKIFSKKKYEELLQKLTDLGLEIEYQKSQNEILEKQVDCLLKDARERSVYEHELVVARKEIKRLKALLTKNKISYKKEDKNGRK